MKRLLCLCLAILFFLPAAQAATSISLETNERLIAYRFSLPGEQFAILEWKAPCESGKIVLAVMDICGAMSLKTHYENVVTVHIKKDTRALLRAILEEDSSIDDKVGRIVSIEDEKRNEEICDFVLSNQDNEKTADKILELLEL